MNRRAINALFTALVIASLLACTLPGPKTQTVEPTATLPPTATATRPPTATAAATATPTATPTPSPTPLPPVAPLLLYREPDRGEELDVDSPLVLTFDQAMDRVSVEEAFSIEPQVKGRFEWAADRILIFEPEKPWQREAAYRVSVATSARSQEGLPLREDVSFRFITTGYLEVTQVQPTDGTTEVDVDSTVTVMFNRPVVPLVSVGEMEDLPDPLTFDPPIAGKGEWLNTSIYVWKPDDGFQPSTAYQVTVQAGLEDTTGGVLAEDLTWSFTTVLPRVTWAYPRDGEQFVGPSEAISVTFNQPMDMASVEDKFSLTYAKGTQVAGRFSWSEDHTSFQFAPDEPLPRNTPFTAQVAKDALGAAGSEGTSESYMWTFTTVDDPRIVSISPADGTRDASPYGGVYVQFSAPMDRTTLFDNLTIAYYDPNQQEGGAITSTQVYSYWYNYDTELSLSFHMRASSQFTVTLGDGQIRQADRRGHDHALYHPRTGSELLLCPARPGRHAERLHDDDGDRRLSQRLSPRI
jgi:hypothetical protein